MFLKICSDFCMCLCYDTSALVFIITGFNRSNEFICVKLHNSGFISCPSLSGTFGILIPSSNIFVCPFDTLYLWSSKSLIRTGWGRGRSPETNVQKHHSGWQCSFKRTIWEFIGLDSILLATLPLSLCYRLDNHKGLWQLPPWNSALSIKSLSQQYVKSIRQEIDIG